MVARVSTLVFIGEKVCRDEDWINVSVNYTIDAFTAARELRRWPSILRPIVHWFIPATQKLRKHLSVARSIFYSDNGFAISRGLRYSNLHSKTADFPFSSG